MFRYLRVDVLESFDRSDPVAISLGVLSLDGSAEIKPFEPDRGNARAWEAI
jgi:hypothetical protein